MLHFVLRTMTPQKLQVKNIVVLQAWLIFTRTRTIAMFYSNVKLSAQVAFVT